MIKYQTFNGMHDALADDLKKAYEDVFDSQWYIGGNHLSKFEEEYAKYCNRKYCVGCGNGLDAIRIMLEACNIGYGDEVIVPANTFIATAIAVSQTGATPVLVEPEYNTLLMDPERIEDAITPNTRAIIAVHLYGRLQNMERICDVAKAHNLLLFEDVAQAHGARDEAGKIAGSYGIAAAFSFYPGKNLGALGDAGCVVTDDEEVERKARAIGNYGSEIKYHHDVMGFNSRLDELQAAFLSVKLPHLDEWNAERKRIAKKYYEKINNDCVILPKYIETNVYHIFPILCERRDELQQYLKDLGIMTLIHYPVPIHMQGAYSDMGRKEGDFPISEHVARTELSLPIYPGLSESEVDEVVNAINSFK